MRNGELVNTIVPLWEQFLRTRRVITFGGFTPCPFLIIFLFVLSSPIAIGQ